tara:strand:- start:1214 stop:1600 length:387 start_codon:yes stop_codon:yes gene_type:complete
MKKYHIQTDQAPAAIGPYSQAVKVGDFLYISGQIAIDPANGDFINGSINQQTERVLNNLEAVLQADGLTLEHVAKTQVYLINMAEFESMNKIYEKFFNHHKPARACIQAAALPKGARVEIDAIAYKER